MEQAFARNRQGAIRATLIAGGRNRVQMDIRRQRWLKSQEAAELLGISIWTLRHWVSERKITFVKKGRMVRFREEDLERFMNSGLVRANAAPGSEE